MRVATLGLHIIGLRGESAGKSVNIGRAGIIPGIGIVR